MPKRAVIGIDLDNTIVNYEEVCRKLLSEQGCDCLFSGNARSVLKSHLMSQLEGNLKWTLVQGHLYGNGMKDASLYPGVLDAFLSLLTAGFEIHILSHKSRYPAIGQPMDFHECAHQFLCERLISSIEDRFRDQVKIAFFPTQDAKVKAIKMRGCMVFVDDLLSVLRHPEFPCHTEGFHFDPENGKDWYTLLPLLRKAIYNHPNASCCVDHRSSALRPDPVNCFKQLIESIGDEMDRFESLSGGINNAVYHLVARSGKNYCGKYYRRDPDDPRDRMHHEMQFLAYCQACGIHDVPKVEAFDTHHGVVLLEWISGSRWPEQKVVPDSVWKQFLKFFEKLQLFRDIPEAAALPRAAEAARSLHEHLAWVQKRRDHWRFLALNGSVPEEQRDYVIQSLEMRYQDLARRCMVHPEFFLPFPDARAVISPSDFGLHNALIDENGNVRFVDFEYGGWDDIAKLKFDFCLQPRYPCPIGGLWSFPGSHHACDSLVGEVLELKWLYIRLAATINQSNKNL
jgi:hypothetical protein